MISVTINGELRQFEAPLNCIELLARLELAGKRVALECNTLARQLEPGQQLDAVEWRLELPELAVDGD